MKAYVLHAVGDLRYEDIPMPECPSSDWAIVKFHVYLVRAHTTFLLSLATNSRALYTVLAIKLMPHGLVVASEFSLLYPADSVRSVLKSITKCAKITIM